MYDVSKNPLVLGGKRKPEEIMKEFSAAWDKNTDGTITLQEFIDYYVDISVCVDDGFFLRFFFASS